MIYALTKKGKIICISEHDIPLFKLYSKKGRRYYPKGIKLMNLDEKDEMIGLVSI